MWDCSDEGTYFNYTFLALKFFWFKFLDDLLLSTLCFTNINVSSWIPWSFFVVALDEVEPQSCVKSMCMQDLTWDLKHYNWHLQFNLPVRLNLQSAPYYPLVHVAGPKRMTCQSYYRPEKNVLRGQRDEIMERNWLN